MGTKSSVEWSRDAGSKAWWPVMDRLPCPVGIEVISGKERGVVNCNEEIACKLIDAANFGFQTPRRLLSPPPTDTDSSAIPV